MGSMTATRRSQWPLRLLLSPMESTRQWTPPQEGDEDVNVMGGMVARLGLGEGGVVRPGAQAELMEQLGLGEGTRVVDLQVRPLIFHPRD